MFADRLPVPLLSRRLLGPANAVQIAACASATRKAIGSRLEWYNSGLGLYRLAAFSHPIPGREIQCTK
jgi:hypothetical protein